MSTRSEIEGWRTGHLTDAAARWRAAADNADNLFERHRNDVGGADWSGSARDAAYDRVTTDVSVAQRHGQVQREAAKLAEDGSQDIQAAKAKALEAITEAETDGFKVGEDLTVKDGRRYDIMTIQSRNQAAKEHAENIQWNAEQLVQADSLVGQRLQEKATELGGITFEDRTIQAASFGGFKQDGPPMLPPDAGPAAPPTVLHGYDPRIAGLPPVLQDYVSGQLQGKPLPQPPVDPVTEQQLRERLRTQQEILDLKLAELQRKYGVSCSESEIYTKIAGVLATGAAMGAGAPTAVTPPGFIAELGGIVSVKAQIDAIHKCFGEGA